VGFAITVHDLVVVFRELIAAMRIEPIVAIVTIAMAIMFRAENVLARTDRRFGKRVTELRFNSAKFLRIFDGDFIAANALADSQQILDTWSVFMHMRVSFY